MVPNFGHTLASCGNILKPHFMEQQNQDLLGRFYISILLTAKVENHYYRINLSKLVIC